MTVAETPRRMKSSNAVLRPRWQFFHAELTSRQRRQACQLGLGVRRLARSNRFRATASQTAAAADAADKKG